MRRPRRTGFTLIELLVVIAIIGILAAMLFPVFARARESARKTQCLANVKNIAMAINMYMGDWEAMPPYETRKEVINWIDTVVYPDNKQTFDAPNCTMGTERINPYLRFPVLLDDYVKNRDVWRCPSAKLAATAQAIVPMGPNGDWFLGVQNAYTAGIWGDGQAVCLKDNVFPPGWGGEVTDSFTQMISAGDWMMQSPQGNRVFTGGIAVNGDRGLKFSGIGDTAEWVVCGDGGAWMEVMSVGILAYPDKCNVECANCWCSMSWIGLPDCQDSIQDGCPDTWDCFQQGYHAVAADLVDRTRLKPWTRHLGGTNIGFMDGHAKWWSAESLVNKHKEIRAATGDGHGLGLWVWGPTSFDYPASCGWPASEPQIY